jgi:hypothetical protein
MTFNLTLNVAVERDASGVVRSLEHLQQPYTLPAGIAPPTTQALSRQYLMDVAEIFSIPTAMLQDLGAPLSDNPNPHLRPGLRFAAEKLLTQTTIVSYVQTVLGLPIWEAGFSISLLPEPFRGVSSVSSVHLAVDITPPSSEAPYLKPIDPAVLGRLLGLNGVSETVPAVPRINSTRLLVYRYVPVARFDPEVESPIQLFGGPPTLPLPPVPATIVSGHHYVIRECLFTSRIDNIGDVHWRTFVEVETGGVLYLRAAVSAAKGFVYLQDPMTALGGPLPTAPAAQLGRVGVWRGWL